MSQTLKDFLNARKAEIKAQQAALRKELSDILAAEAAISQAGAEPEISSRRQASGITIKDMVVDVMESFPQGATAMQIIEKVKDKHGKDIPRYSMSPQLSRLKDDGLLVLSDVDKLWRLAGDGLLKKTEAPQGAPVGDGVEAPSNINISGATQTDNVTVDDVFS